MIEIDARSRPRLARGVRLRLDRITGKKLLLRPEQGFELQGSADAIVKLCTSDRSVAQIIDQLAELQRDVTRDQIAEDVTRVLADLARRGLIVVGDEPLTGNLAVPSTDSADSASSTDTADSANSTDSTSGTPRPYTLVAELTYRCPLRCAYCSNPVHLDAMGAEIDAATWARVFKEAEALGVMQVTLTGGEPLLRPDLEQLVRAARASDLYTTLITSGIPTDRDGLARLRDAGLDGVQLSFQDVDTDAAARVAGVDALTEKEQVAGFIRDLGLPLTLNIVLHRENLPRLPALIAMAESLGANRLELAHVQYLGWALANRSLLLPSATMIAEARATVAAARARLSGRMEILAVLPDYFSDRPRACMDGWGRRYMVVAPDGRVLPCHAAHTLPSLTFDNVAARSLGDIWKDSTAFARFRGENWMPEPCRGCDQRGIDFGGCRCQSYHLTGDMTLTDPTCSLSPRHDAVRVARAQAEGSTPPSESRLLRLRRPPSGP